MPYFCSRLECGYIWDKRGRTDKKTRCPRCRTRKTFYVRHLNLRDIENFIKRRKQYLKDHPHVEKPKPEPREKVPKEPGRPKIHPSSGQIEYFHKKYREWKENRRIQREYDPRIQDKDPSVNVVSEWFRSTKKSRTIRDRWATELLEKYKPNN